MLNPVVLTAAEPSNAFVVALGMGTVFVGLICIVILCTIMSAICNKFIVKAPNAQEAAAPVTPVQATKKVQIQNKGEFVAAIAAAVAEETGEDVSGIRILSIKQK